MRQRGELAKQWEPRVRWEITPINLTPPAKLISPDWRNYYSGVFFQILAIGKSWTNEWVDNFCVYIKVDPLVSGIWDVTSCKKTYEFVCEREQPYRLSTCPPEQHLTNAKLTYPRSGYYPLVPQGQRMKCYYYHSGETTMSHIHADRFCSSIGGYIMMPKTVKDLDKAIWAISPSNGRRLWLGADSTHCNVKAYCYPYHPWHPLEPTNDLGPWTWFIHHCISNTSRCASNKRDFKYLDGSNFTLNNKLDWGSGQPDYAHNDLNCIEVNTADRKINDELCTEARDVICQVDHNNLRSHRNWDSIFMILGTENEFSVSKWRSQRNKQLIDEASESARLYIESCLVAMVTIASVVLVAR